MAPAASLLTKRDTLSPVVPIVIISVLDDIGLTIYIFLTCCLREAKEATQSETQLSRPIKRERVRASAGFFEAAPRLAHLPPAFRGADGRYRDEAGAELMRYPRPE